MKNRKKRSILFPFGNSLLPLQQSGSKKRKWGRTSCVEYIAIGNLAAGRSLAEKRGTKGDEVNSFA